jgi:hypothetical protein
MLDDKQKKWILAHKDMRQLVTSTNKLLKDNKLGWVEVKEILKYYQNMKGEK